MVDRLIKILNNNNSIDGWLLSEKHITSCEQFFIKQNLDMNRSKDVKKINLTVYKDFEQDGKKYKGSASTLITPAMDDKEIISKIEDLSVGASYIKNEFYELAKPSKDPLKMVKTDMDKCDLSDFMPKIAKAMFLEDIHENGKINSFEVFLEKKDIRIANSNAVDESYTSYSGFIELVVDWKESSEEVEIYEMLEFSEYNEKVIRKFVKDTLECAKLRATCKPTPKLNDIPIILTRESVKEFFNFYIEKANARTVYQKYSDFKIGDQIQGESISGDSITISMVADIENSTHSRYIDNDGVKLSDIKLYENGVLNQYFGNIRFSSYLGLTPTGDIKNVVVNGGINSFENLSNEPHLELLYFSDFQMNDITGDFGGEIRLGKYFDGKKTHYVTGGSISGNINNVKSTMLFSTEIEQVNNFIGPKAIKLFGIEVAV